MTRTHNLQNWNSGVLTRTEVLLIIEVLIELSNGRLIAMDVTGDFSKVKTQGIFRSYLHETQHEEVNNSIRQDKATVLNEETNHEILLAVTRALEKSFHYKSGQFY